MLFILAKQFAIAFNVADMGMWWFHKFAYFTLDLTNFLLVFSVLINKELTTTKIPVVNHYAINVKSVFNTLRWLDSRSILQ